MDRDRDGFTLIELMIVALVVVLFSGLSLANYGKFNEEKKLEGEVKKVSSILYLARTKASAANTDVSLSSCSDFQGYIVTTSEPSNNYKLERNCGGVPSSPALQTYKFFSNVKTTTSVQILFKPFDAGTDLTSQAKITVMSVPLTKCIDIFVSPLGIVTEGAKYTTGCP